MIVINLIKRIVAKIASPLNDNPIKLIHIDDTSILDNTTLGKWIKIQKQSYFYNSNIGSYTYFAGFNSVMNAEIGKFCSIGSNVSIGPGRHPVNYVSTSPVFYSEYKQCGYTFADKSYYPEMGTVTIGNDVWIGTNAVILDDIVIGDGAIIAAGAVVTKNVEPYSIVGGVPAKFIKKRFSEDIIAELLASKWWDMSQDWLAENYKLFHDTERFIQALKNK